MSGEFAPKLAITGVTTATAYASQSAMTLAHAGAGTPRPINAPIMATGTERLIGYANNARMFSLHQSLTSEPAGLTVQTSQVLATPVRSSSGV